MTWWKAPCAQNVDFSIVEMADRSLSDDKAIPPRTIMCARVSIFAHLGLADCVADVTGMAGRIGLNLAGGGQ
jgi:hypothetical protein